MPLRTRLLSVVVVLLATTALHAGELDALLDPVHPDVKKWATVVLVGDEEGRPTFTWHEYRESRDDVDFWPASTIKIYAVVAALEKLNELEMPTDSVLLFEHQFEGRWVLDAARTMPEMLSEVFKRSSNEDYTLLLRFVGIDRINSQFLIPEHGFPHSALMRGYIRGRPYEYVREEPQRITLLNPQADGPDVGQLTTPSPPLQGRVGVGGQSVEFNPWTRVEHTWSGISYANQRGATVLSDTTGNCTSTHELADCLRRLFFHEALPPDERFRLTPEQLQLVRKGRDGLVGLENKNAGPHAWNGAKSVFPRARYYHKAGWISTYSLDAAYLHDPATNTRFLLAVAAKTGEREVIQEMAKRVAEWVKSKTEIQRRAESSGG